MADGQGAAAPTHLVIGQVSKPHGTKGDVFVVPLTDRPDEMFAADRIVLTGDEDGRATDETRELTIEQSRPFKRGVLVKFAGFDDRTAVEELSSTYLLVPFEDVEPLEEGEVFYHELLGLEVHTVDGVHVGRIREVYESAPADLLEVKSDDGRMRLVPFTKQIVREVNLETRTMTIDPPEGLLDV